ncbi:CBS domain-containing protein [Colwellia sp. 1_MG-2023]|jgi:predicted transcriptional regulator|uniref:CBS domain-containing protein n=1 Tax=unclassified Colwellia TaxID=196834 RepID=UPI001C086EF1|nr:MULTISPECIES: CBS domain-containing protein [unclassified Colwellia]MBU2924305.1 CBS domain-containing protein [Colwellia sp. C2M11]MDO6487163.1 CBS domain-containing protein [Colwellia sp. 6_MG-2023]MDO6650893.1 CBS domain-containing protein [Colwellia sp. 3_MG-2023]MDO6663928.1 CBS domain-containing protein [Colwellia sp. 2_MG-2023]MDO6688279.1 CBS domain-containing protein [Colwellia sp. 1_MG-2023]
MKTLSLLDLDKIDQIATPEQFQDINMHSPAINIFTDFNQHKPLMIDASTLAVDAIKLMMKEHVHMKIVVTDEDEFLGVITSNEVSEQNIMAKIAQGFTREELLVSDVMITRASLNAFNFEELEKAKVSDVIEALKHYKVRHCLVLDQSHHHIRGVISSSDIARKLKLPITIDVATSFSKIFNSIND